MLVHVGKDTTFIEMGRIASPLAEDENQFRVSRPELPDSPHNRFGLKRNANWKRKLLRLPPQKRQKARQSTLKRSPLKRESKGHKAEMVRYNASAPAFFAEEGNDVCHICLRLREDGDNILLRPSTERHHTRGRIGRLLNWRPGQMPSCRGHRTWPHDNPSRARKLGILCEAKDWNVYPD